MSNPIANIQKRLDQIETILSQKSMKTPIASILSLEYVSSEDLDDNKLIYGQDFIFVAEDTPIMLKQINATVLNTNPKILQINKDTYHNKSSSSWKEV